MTQTIAYRSPDLGSTSSVGDTARRAVLLSAIVSLHLLLILWLAGGPTPKPVVKPAVMSVFTLPLSSGPAASVQPTRPEAPSPAARAPIPTEHGLLAIAAIAPAIAASRAIAQAGAAAGGCALARDAGDAIAHDASAMAEIDALSPEVRTSADAVMLWDGQWLDPGVMPEGVDAGSLRRVVEQVVAFAPLACRDAEARGPQFVPIPEGNRTVMIVIGSGLWRWADLAGPVADCTAADTPTCSPLEPTTLTSDNSLVNQSLYRPVHP